LPQRRYDAGALYEITTGDIVEAVLDIALVRYAALLCCGQAYAASAAKRKTSKRGREKPILLINLVANWTDIESPP
jgi:hypothetical protein